MVHIAEPHTGYQTGTPLAPGSSSRSDRIQVVGAHVPQPFVYHDVLQAEKCGVDNMLRGLLRLAGHPESVHDLLKECIEGVLDICNGDALQIPGIRKPASDIKVHLQQCATATQENDMYEPFVEGCNIALEYLKNVAFGGTPTSNQGMNTLFQQCDPIPIHNMRKSALKPNVVICSFDGISSEVTTSWEDYVLRDALKKPHCQWFDVLSSVQVMGSELVRSQSHKLYIYTSAPIPVIPQYILDSVSDLPASDPSCESREGTTGDRPSGSRASLDNSGTHWSRLENSRAGVGQKYEFETTTSRPSKRPRLEHPTPGEYIACQTAFHAAESFAANLAATRVINLIVRGYVIYIWYFDRQGIIQSAGINYLEDLPRFMVLLYAIQRMDNEAFGRHRGFEPKIEESQDSRKIMSYKLNVEADGGDVELKLNVGATGKACVTHFGLTSRATNVIPITKFKGFSLGADSQGPLVAKVYWPEEQREDEVEILLKVEEIAKKNTAVSGHVPKLIWSHAFHEDSTTRIRNALGISKSEKGGRKLHILVFPELLPISDLKEDELLRAWKDCVRCHRELWMNGVYHRDVSKGNLMYRRVDGKVQGVLIDFDLASLSLEGRLGNEPTGTVPFIALELLTDEAVNGRVKHLYRHDIESLVWTLVYIVLREKQPRLLNQWVQAGLSGCRTLKQSFLLDRRKYLSARSSGPECMALNCLNLIKKLLDWKETQLERLDAGEIMAGDEGMSDDTVFGFYHDVIFEGKSVGSLQL